MAVTFSSNYAGDNLPQLLEAMVLGAQAIEKGSVNVMPDHHQQVHLPRLTAADDVLTTPVETPTVAADAFTYDERTITQGDMMLFDLVNPRTFEDAWREFQPTGDLVDAVNSPEVQNAIIREAAKTVGKQLGKIIWQGDTAGAAPIAFFDGYEKILGDAGVPSVKITPAGVITQANVISILDALLAGIPDEVYDDPNMIIHMNTTDYRHYQAAARALDFKGPNIGDAQDSRFGGLEVRHYSGMSKDKIIAAKATAGMDSNLHAATWLEGDRDNVKLERYRPESELFIVKVLFKFGVNVGFPGETAIYLPA